MNYIIMYNEWGGERGGAMGEMWGSDPPPHKHTHTHTHTSFSLSFVHGQLAFMYINMWYYIYI